MGTGMALAEGILEGDIEYIIIALISFALAIYWFMRVYVLPGRQWKQPSGPKERTYFYRRKKVTEEERRPRGSGRRRGSGEGDAGGPPDTGS